MNDSIKAKRANVYIQENGIIRLTSTGYLIGRLSDDLGFDEPEDKGALVNTVPQNGEMTEEEEAIDVIKVNYPPENYTTLREALDLAIKALGGTGDE